MWEKGGLVIVGLLFGDCDPDIYKDTKPPVTDSTPIHDGYGAQMNDTGMPIGGGPGYESGVDPSTATRVRTFDELVAAIDAHRAQFEATGDARSTIYVDDDVTIETADARLSVAPGLTIASGRGVNGSLGGLISAATDGTKPMFDVQSGFGKRAVPPVRFTGLRLRGPDPGERAPDCSSNGRTGIFFAEKSVRDGEAGVPENIVDRRIQIDNNEIYAWKVASSFSGVRGAIVHHNHFHHNRRHAHRYECAIKLQFHAAGYGVAVNLGHALIVANVFDANRHAIASHGNDFTDYEAYYNVVIGKNVSHSFDMHGGIDREDGTYIAGRSIIIAFNTLLDPDKDAVNVRGHPSVGAWVYKNELRQDEGSVVQTKVPLDCDSDGCEMVNARMNVFDNRENVKATPWLSLPPRTEIISK